MTNERVPPQFVWYRTLDQYDCWLRSCINGAKTLQWRGRYVRKKHEKSFLAARSNYPSVFPIEFTFGSEQEARGWVESGGQLVD